MVDDTLADQIATEFALLLDDVAADGEARVAISKTQTATLAHWRSAGGRGCITRALCDRLGEAAVSGQLGDGGSAREALAVLKAFRQILDRRRSSAVGARS